MKTLSLVGLLFLSLMSCAAAGWAQEDTFPHFYFSTPMNLQSGRDFGVLDGNRTVDDSMTLLTAPTFTLRDATPRGDFLLTYDPQFEFFAHNGHMSSWNHTAGLTWNYKISPRWTVDASDGFVATRDDSLRFISAFVLPRGPYRENVLDVRLTRELSPQSRIRIHFDDSFEHFRQENVIQPIFFSRMTNTVGITAEKRFNPKHKLTADYSYLRSHSFDKFDMFGFPIGSYAPSHLATLTYDYNPVPSVLLEASGGYVHTGGSSYVFAGSVEKHLSRITIAGGFSRYLSVVGVPGTPAVLAISGPIGARGLPPNTLSDTLSFHLRGDISRHIMADIEFLGTRTASGVAGTNLKGVLGGARIGYKLTDRLTWFVGSQFFGQNASLLIPESMSRKRVFMGLEYTFSPTAEEVSRRRDAYDSRDKTPPITLGETVKDEKQIIKEEKEK